LKQVAAASFLPARLPKGLPPGLIESATYSPEQSTYPNGCHVCEVEIDPETGAVELKSYLVVDDVGTVINPLTLAGQIHGGVAQGVGQILMEQVAYQAGNSTSLPKRRSRAGGRCQGFSPTRGPRRNAISRHGS
jgi:carbon-monoxide dehydrogenase large subunit